MTDAWDRSPSARQFSRFTPFYPRHRCRLTILWWGTAARSAKQVRGRRETRDVMRSAPRFSLAICWMKSLAESLGDAGKRRVEGQGARHGCGSPCHSRRNCKNAARWCAHPPTVSRSVQYGRPRRALRTARVASVNSVGEPRLVMRGTLRESPVGVVASHKSRGQFVPIPRGFIVKSLIAAARRATPIRHVESLLSWTFMSIKPLILNWNYTRINFGTVVFWNLLK